MTEYTLIDVPAYGWLCRIDKNNTEVYRGEYQKTPLEAIEKAIEWNDDYELRAAAAELAAITPREDQEALMFELRDGY